MAPSWRPLNTLIISALRLPRPSTWLSVRGPPRAPKLQTGTEPRHLRHVPVAIRLRDEGVLARTTPDEPFAAIDIDLAMTAVARERYPCYVFKGKSG